VASQNFHGRERRDQEEPLASKQPSHFNQRRADLLAKRSNE
jgi:hypothetical protein